MRINFPQNILPTEAISFQLQEKDCYVRIIDPRLYLATSDPLQGSIYIELHALQEHSNGSTYIVLRAETILL